ncbi:MAG: hypothetical protein KIT45_15335, partial [Fimbriimonadia bacterium]|nr:hypothetical protein [Fimbriimonadia bacterium]
LLPPGVIVTQKSKNLDPSLHGVGIVIGVIGGLTGGAAFTTGCTGLAAGVGKGTLDGCNKAGFKHCDKLAHCMGMCVARKCGTRILSWCLGWIKEILPSQGWMDPDDFAANHQGEKCAVSGDGLLACATCCVGWWFGEWPQHRKKKR